MPRLSRWFVRASLLYLAAGVTLGALMLGAKALAAPALIGRLLLPHVEFLLVGWTVQLTMGVAFWILPRFEGGASRGPEGPAWGAFVLVNTGVLLAGLAPELGAPQAALLLGRLAEAGAAVAFGAHAWLRVRRASVP